MPHTELTWKGFPRNAVSVIMSIRNVTKLELGPQNSRVVFLSNLDVRDIE